MDAHRGADRRRFLVGAAAAGLSFAAPAAAKEREGAEDISATEDLMREHGVLRRVLLCYDEVVRRLEAREPVPAEPLARAAHVVRAFVEDYHERDEEEFLFPRFEKAGRLVALVGVLRQQHQAGRRLTDEIARLATPARLAPAPRELGVALREFTAMYRPHAAREDTVLFPAFRALVGERELQRVRGTFEQRERALGEGTFEKMVVEVARIEEQLGIADLARFTPVEKR
jgi:hemerythrin-like domain-containing protein